MLLHQSSVTCCLYEMQRNSSEACRQDTGQCSFSYFNPTFMNNPSAKSKSRQTKEFSDNNKKIFFGLRKVYLFYSPNGPFSQWGKVRDPRGNEVLSFFCLWCSESGLLGLGCFQTCFSALSDEVSFHGTRELKSWYPVLRPYLEGKDCSSAF